MQTCRSACFVSRLCPRARGRLVTACNATEVISRRNIVLRPVLACTFLSIMTISASTHAEQGVSGVAGKGPDLGTVAFSTVGRGEFGFDIYAVELVSLGSSWRVSHELKLTDGKSINWNGAFGRSKDQLLFVSERGGRCEIYSSSTEDSEQQLQPLTRPVVSIGFQDRPTLLHSGSQLLFASTHRPAAKPRQSWTAVYTADFATGDVTRLTPEGTTDLSPVVSSDGKWVAVASGGGKTGESDIVVMAADDGGHRRTITANGGWPTFSANGDSVFFHRLAEDGWWSIYRRSLDGGKEERLTPDGIDVFTPAAFPDADVVAVATRREQGGFRHIELLQQKEGGWELHEVTQALNPHMHHYNPFISTHAGVRVGYHRCRGPGASTVPNVMGHDAGKPGLSLMRVNGEFPSISHDGRTIAFNGKGFEDIMTMELDGSQRQTVYEGKAWSTTQGVHNGRRIIMASHGPSFAGGTAGVSIVAAVEQPGGKGGWEARALTGQEGQNNAFPSISPDGNEVVFRSARSGHKNLYIMDAEGEDKGLRCLTEGAWTDTMPNWAPSGELIVFTSDRNSADPGESMHGFDLWVVCPDGSGLQKLLDSHGGLSTHPYFSPDSQHIVFASDRAGYSAEEISVPHQFQPYGELFIMKVDGSGIQRLTHNPYEDGTPCWGPAQPGRLSDAGDELKCSFRDSGPHTSADAKQRQDAPVAGSNGGPAMQGCPFHILTANRKGMQ